jgi:hypothetical protein
MFTRLSTSEIELLIRSAPGFTAIHDEKASSDSEEENASSVHDSEGESSHGEEEDEEEEEEEEEVGATCSTDNDLIPYGVFFEGGAGHEEGTKTEQEDISTVARTPPFLRLLFHYHMTSCIAFTQTFSNNIDKYSAVPVQGPQKGCRVISIRNIARAFIEANDDVVYDNVHVPDVSEEVVEGGVESSSTSNTGIPSAHAHAKRHAKHRSIMKTLKKSTNVVVHQCCDRIHRMACTVCPHDVVYIPNKARGILKKNSNHLLLIEDVKHAIRWGQGMDSIDLIGPYMWCRDYQK